MEYPSLDKPKAGAFRFNTDSSQLEIYDGNQWTGVLATSPYQQTGGTRGLSMGGEDPGNSDVIQYINVDSTGDATDFGNLSQTRGTTGCCASRTRGLAASGYESGYHNVIDMLMLTSYYFLSLIQVSKH